MPRIPKTKTKNVSKRITFPKEGRDWRRAFTWVRIPGTEEIVLRGFNNRTHLTALTLIGKTKPIHPQQTTKKSNWFQQLRR
jgi:hypothetical protein